MIVELTLFFVCNSVIALAIGLVSGSRRALQLILAYGIALSVFGVISLYVSLSKAEGGIPYLFNGDGEAYFAQAVSLKDAGILSFQEIVQSNYSGFQILLAVSFTVFGASLAVALATNNTLLLLSMLTLYRATFVLTQSPTAARLACIAFSLTATHIFNSLLILKDPALGLAFSLILLTTAETLRGQGFRPRHLVYLFAATLIVASMRGTLLVFLVVYLCLLAGLAMRRAHILIAFAAALSVMIFLAQSFTTYQLDLDFFVGTVTESQVLSSSLSEGVDASGVVGRVSTAYLTLPFPLRAALFIVPVVIQYFLPFDFFSSAFIHDHFAALFSRNLNAVWVAFVGVWAVFCVANYKRTPDLLLRRLVLGGAFYYVAVAVIYGGAVPRYGAPALFFIYPAIGYWWAQSRIDASTLAAVRGFFYRYYALLTILIVVYLIFQLVRWSL